MSKRSLIDQLNDAVEAQVFGRGASERNDQLDVLSRIGKQLQLRARDEFKNNLKAKILGKGTDMSTATVTAGKGVREGYHTITPYIIVSDAPAVVEFVKQTFGGEELSRGFGSAGGYHIDARVQDS